VDQDGERGQPWEGARVKVKERINMGSFIKRRTLEGKGRKTGGKVIRGAEDEKPRKGSSKARGGA